MHTEPLGSLKEVSTAKGGVVVMRGPLDKNQKGACTPEVFSSHPDLASPGVLELRS